MHHKELVISIIKVLINYRINNLRILVYNLGIGYLNTIMNILIYLALKLCPLNKNLDF